MSSTQSVKIQLRRATSAEWKANTAQVLSQGEPGLEFNTSGNATLRIGDGLNPWSLLPVQLSTENVNTYIPGLTGLLGGVVTQSLVPDKNLTYDLGATGARFRDLYLSGNSLYLGNLKLSANPDGTLANVNSLIPGLTGLLGGVITQPLIPDRSAGYDIGSTGSRFGDIFMGAGYTLNVGNMQIGANPDGTLANVNALIPGITALLGGVVTQHLIPNQNITYDLGATGARFRDLYLSSNSINLGDLKVSANPDGTLALEQIIQPVLSGASGSSGASGASGASGSTGPTSRLVSTLGARGPTGPPGAPGATGPDPNFKYRGVFTTGEIYKIGDVVTDNTNLYYCTGLITGWTGTVSYNTGDVIRSPSTGYYFQARSNLPVGNTAPYNATTPEWLIIGSPPSQYWAIIAKAGANGSQGATGANGSPGATGAAGVNGSPGATGAAGQAISFAGNYNPSTTYSGGQLVKYNGSVYYLAPYDNNYAYRTGNVVSYNGVLYQASTNLDAGRAPPNLWNVITQTAPPSAMWNLVVNDSQQGKSVSFAGNYNPSTTYSGGQLVNYNGSVYMYSGVAYDNNVAYRTGDLVSYSGVLYQASTNLDAGRVPPTFWNVIPQTAPPSTMWNLVVSDGVTGTRGATGPGGYPTPTALFVTTNDPITLPSTSQFYMCTIIAIGTGGGGVKTGYQNQYRVNGAGGNVIVCNDLLLLGGSIITPNIGLQGGAGVDYETPGNFNFGLQQGSEGAGTSFSINGVTGPNATGGRTSYIRYSSPQYVSDLVPGPVNNVSYYGTNDFSLQFQNNNNIVYAKTIGSIRTDGSPQSSMGGGGLGTMGNRSVFLPSSPFSTMGIDTNQYGRGGNAGERGTPGCMLISYYPIQ
jgi:hypothetical protein